MTGRFVTEDPARDGGNWYLYVGANPLGFVDPSGLSDIALNPGEWLSDPTGFQNPRMFPVYYGQGSWLRGIKQFFQWLGLGTAVAMSEATDGGEEAAEDEDGQAAEASDAGSEAAADSRGEGTPPDDEGNNPDVTQRPPGVPEDWIARPQKDGGVRWTNPSNPHDFVRSSPAKPSAEYPSQHVPNIKRHKPSGYRDVNDNPLPDVRRPDAHIPLDDFTFSP